ncbi:hypothetical protein SMICM304S_09210 [Streptomyces microflavus]
MAGAVEARLAELGLTLPAVVPPLASYQPAVQSGVQVYTSGQLPMVDGKLAVTGKVGAEVTPDEAKELARTCALNALAAVKSVAGDLDRIKRVVKVVGFVASASSSPGSRGGRPAVVGRRGTAPPCGDVVPPPGCMPTWDRSLWPAGGRRCSVRAQLEVPPPDTALNLKRGPRERTAPA